APVHGPDAFARDLPFLVTVCYLGGSRHRRDERSGARLGSAGSIPSVSKRGASEALRRHMPAVGSPTRAIRSRIVFSVNAAGSAPGTSSQRSGAEARASGVGRFGYAAAVVRSRAFWP